MNRYFELCTLNFVFPNQVADQNTEYKTLSSDFARILLSETRV